MNKKRTESKLFVMVDCFHSRFVHFCLYRTTESKPRSMQIYLSMWAGEPLLLQFYLETRSLQWHPAGSSSFNATLSGREHPAPPVLHAVSNCLKYSNFFTDTPNVEPIITVSTDSQKLVKSDFPLHVSLDRFCYSFFETCS